MSTIFTFLDDEPTIANLGAGGGVPSPIQIAVLTLTDAQIKLLPAAAVTIVAAPGAGKAILPVIGLCVLTASVGYGNVDQFTKTINVNVGSVTALDGTWTNEFFEATGRMSPLAPNLVPDGNDPPLALLTGNAATIANQAAEFAVANTLGNYNGGNAGNSLKIIMYYAVVNL